MLDPVNQPRQFIALADLYPNNGRKVLIIGLADGNYLPMDKYGLIFVKRKIVVMK